MDPSDSWDSYVKANAGVGPLRIGLAKDYSALYFPRLFMVHGDRVATVNPAGAVAGLMARTDANRGVSSNADGLVSTN